MIVNHGAKTVPVCVCPEWLVLQHTVKSKTQSAAALPASEATVVSGAERPHTSSERRDSARVLCLLCTVWCVHSSSCSPLPWRFVARPSPRVGWLRTAGSSDGSIARPSASASVRTGRRCAASFDSSMLFLPLPLPIPSAAIHYTQYTLLRRACVRRPAPASRALRVIKRRRSTRATTM